MLLEGGPQAGGDGVGAAAPGGVEVVEHTQDEALFDEASGTAGPGSAPAALYRRYRPDTFADVIGQEHVTAPLQRALTNNRVSHA